MTDFTKDEAYLQSLSEEDLDEIVHDLKSQEASDINNAGKEAQIEYITGKPKGLEYLVHRLRFILYEYCDVFMQEFVEDMLDNFGVAMVSSDSVEAAHDHREMMGR